MKLREAKNSPAPVVPASFERERVWHKREVALWDWKGKPLHELPKLTAEAWEKQREYELENGRYLPPADAVTFTIEEDGGWGDSYTELVAKWQELEPEERRVARYKKHLANKKAAETRRAKKEAKERAQYEKLKEKFGE